MYNMPGRYMVRSGNDHLLLDNAKCKTCTTLEDCAFEVAAPKLWNKRRFSIRNSSSGFTYKKALKTYVCKGTFDL